MSSVIQRIPAADTAAKATRRKKLRKKDVLSAVDLSSDSISTVMIIGLPWTYKERDLLQLLDRFIGTGTYDFFYMPWNVKHDTNCGCVFVNFKSCVDAAKCTAMLNGTIFHDCTKAVKPCMVVPAHVQGLVKNLEYYRSRAVGACKNPHPPMVFQDGVRVNFHVAVEKLCPKKSKHGGAPNGKGEGSAKMAQVKPAQVKKQPDTSMLKVQDVSPYMKFQPPCPPPGLSLDDFNSNPLAILHQHYMQGTGNTVTASTKFGMPAVREPCREINPQIPVAKFGHNPMLERTCHKEENQLPMKVVPQFCQTREQELLTPSLIFEDVVDDVSSTTASEDDRATDQKSMWLAWNGVSYGFQAETCKGLL
eukprot:gnl/MRDRNA2_/MRDRNA2_132434_c0_seq1.p1 gnl/MRDRNA2_/MRDRNA2_132434_c0~~gnl/MRDRNA2_/MRDRNA2_132434_c0_seq1.p1  ORF type:complete len:363 (+),score=67.90 gnl/MRDRNA2_/MRDRNA2_132434_c0_seq1:119-1207(+)